MGTFVSLHVKDMDRSTDSAGGRHLLIPRDNSFWNHSRIAAKMTVAHCMPPGYEVSRTWSERSYHTVVPNRDAINTK